MHNCSRVYRDAIVQRRLESHLIRGCDGRFIEPVTHATHDAIHVQLSVRAEHDFQQDLSL